MKIFGKIILILSAVVLGMGVLFWFSLKPGQPKKLLWPVGPSYFQPQKKSEKRKEKSLEPYSFENLSKRDFSGGKIEIGKTIEEEEKHSAYFFYFYSEEKKVSGQLSTPKKGEELPVIIMLRGYVDKEIYFTGLGTRKAAGFFAENGFATLAPDFLGFGQSDEESKDILLNRFRRPETVLSLLSSIKNLNQALKDKGLETRVDPEKVFLWGHSNGGQIALSVLEITRREIPITLWSPVSKGFPDSVLQYASELDDEGKMVIRAIREFRENYNPAQYSITEYFDRIQAPIQIHQGTGDQYIAFEDSSALVKILRELGKKITYYVYKNDDHNLKENWDEVVERDLEFFKRYL